MDTSHFDGEIIGGLEYGGDLEGSNPPEKKMIMHFDRAPIHNTRMVMGQLEQSGFKRMEDLSDSPNLARVTSFFMVT
jgi:hypothetical protein